MPQPGHPVEQGEGEAWAGSLNFPQRSGLLGLQHALGRGQSKWAKVTTPEPMGSGWPALPAAPIRRARRPRVRASASQKGWAGGAAEGRGVFAERGSRPADPPGSTVDN